MSNFLHILDTERKTEMKYSHWSAVQALLEVAQREGLTLEDVVQSIDEAIHQAYFTALKEGNQDVIDRWKAIPSAGEIPSAVELVAYLGCQVRELADPSDNQIWTSPLS